MLLAVHLVATTAFLVSPHAGVQHRHAMASSFRTAGATSQVRESRIAKITEISPGERYRQMKANGVKFYEGRKPDALRDLKAQMKSVGTRKVVVITGASSGLGFNCVQALQKTSSDGYFVVCAVRDPEKMVEAAEKAGINRNDYATTELQLASFQSVKDFASDLKQALPGGRLDRLVCNAAVYLPTDPKPRFTDDGYEMSLQVNHLGHFLLVQLLLPAIKKAKDPRVCIVGRLALASSRRHPLASSPLRSLCLALSATSPGLD